MTCGFDRCPNRAKHRGDETSQESQQREFGVKILSDFWTRRLAVAFAIALACSLLAAPFAAAKQQRCHVENLATGRVFSSLRAAVEAASAGASLRVKGTCVGSTLIDKDVAITGFANKAFGRPTLDGAGSQRVLTITAAAQVTLRGLVITNGSSERGGGIATIVDHAFGQSVVTIIDSEISSNTADEGGGIHNGQGVLSLENSIVRNNAAAIGGGIHNSQDNGTLSLRGTSSVTGNVASDIAGGIFSGAHGTISLHDSSSIHHNIAANNGGGMYLDDSEVELHDTSSIHHNTAGGIGGGVIKAAPFAVFSLGGTSSVSDNTPNDYCEISLMSGSYLCT
jgi:hypothetical protein